MSQADLLMEAAPPSVWHMYRAMVGVGVACGLLIVSVFQLTRPIIERNKAEALERAIFVVLPEARSSRAFLAAEEGGFTAADGPASAAAGPRIYGGYREDGTLAGVAVEAQGMGYQDVIVLLWGYSFPEHAIIGVKVLESRETPGLGDKIEKDPDFLRNFERLDVTLAGDGTRLAHPIESVKHGEKRNPWEVDAITGATISSKAVARILNESTAYWVPRIERGRSRLEGGE